MNQFRAFALAFFVVTAGAIWQPVAFLGGHCAGALLAMEQEKKTPPGEWCQRPPVQSEKAHACDCHKHDCDVDPNDINNRSAHTDPKCLNFCTVSQCMCEKMDCP